MGLLQWWLMAPGDVAEGGRFELPELYSSSPLFESGTINHSDTSPCIAQKQYNTRAHQRQETGDHYSSVNELAAASTFSSARA